MRLLIAGSIFIALIFMPASILSAEPVSGAKEGIGSIGTDNYANKKLEYYYYIPAAVGEAKDRKYPLLVVIPGLSGRGENSVTQEFKDFAQKEKFIIIAPSFMYDENNWESQKSYQYPAAWSGAALIKIVNKMKEESGVRISYFYLFGHSAGAQFALRFCLWRPDLCAACAAHASGGSVKAAKNAYVRFFVTVGKQDTSRIKNMQEFYESAKRCGMSVKYKEYDGVGHELSAAQIKDSLEFFKEKH